MLNQKNKRVLMHAEDTQFIQNKDYQQHLTQLIDTRH
jgi:hypothetical protein